MSSRAQVDESIIPMLPPKVAPPPPAAEDSAIPPMPPPEVAPPPASTTPGVPPAAEDIVAIQPAELSSIANTVVYAISVQEPETAAAMLDGNKEVESRSFRMDGQWVAIYVPSAVTAAENGTCAVQAASREDVSSDGKGVVNGLVFFQGSKKFEEIDEPSADEVGPIYNYRQKCLRFKLPVEVAGKGEGKWVLNTSSRDSIRDAILAGPLATFGFKKSDSEFSGSHILLQPQQATPQQDHSDPVLDSFTTSSFWFCPFEVSIGCLENCLQRHHALGHLTCSLDPRTECGMHVITAFVVWRDCWF